MVENVAMLNENNPRKNAHVHLQRTQSRPRSNQAKVIDWLIVLSFHVAGESRAQKHFASIAQTLTLSPTSMLMLLSQHMPSRHSQSLSLSPEEVGSSLTANYIKKAYLWGIGGSWEREREGHPEKMPCGGKSVVRVWEVAISRFLLALWTVSVKSTHFIRRALHPHSGTQIVPFGAHCYQFPRSRGIRHVSPISLGCPWYYPYFPTAWSKGTSEVISKEQFTLNRRNFSPSFLFLPL